MELDAPTPVVSNLAVRTVPPLPSAVITEIEDEEVDELAEDNLDAAPLVAHPPPIASTSTSTSAVSVPAMLATASTSSSTSAPLKFTIRKSERNSKTDPHLITISPDASDALTSRHPPNTTPGDTDEKGRSSHYKLNLKGQGKDIDYRTKTGAGLATMLGETQGKSEFWMLSEMPRNYNLYQHHTPTRQGKDTYVFGAPHRFRSPSEMIPHLFWLIDPTLPRPPCKCIYCGVNKNKSQTAVNTLVGITNPKGAGKRAKSDVAAGSSRASSADRGGSSVNAASPMRKKQKLQMVTESQSNARGDYPRQTGGGEASGSGVIRNGAGSHTPSVDTGTPVVTTQVVPSTASEGDPRLKAKSHPQPTPALTLQDQSKTASDSIKKIQSKDVNGSGKGKGESSNIKTVTNSNLNGAGAGAKVATGSGTLISGASIPKKRKKKPVPESESESDGERIGPVRVKTVDSSRVMDQRSWNGSYPDRSRDGDLNDSVMYREGEMVWIELPQPILERDGLPTCRRITLWPGIVNSHSIKSTSTLLSPLVPGQAPNISITQYFEYSVSLFACTDLMKRREGQMRPWLTHIPSTDITPSEAITHEASVVHVWNGNMTRDATLAKLVDVSTASTAFALALQVAAHVISAFSLCGRFTLNPGHIIPSPDITVAETQDLEKIVRSNLYHSLWWGAERIWTGEIVRFLMPDSEDSPSEARQEIVAIAGRRGRFLKIVALYKDSKASKAMVAGEEFELQDLEIERATEADLPLEAERYSIIDADVETKDYMPVPPAGFAFRRVVYQLVEGIRPKGQLHTEIEHIAGRYYPLPDHLNHKAKIDELLTGVMEMPEDEWLSKRDEPLLTREGRSGHSVEEDKRRVVLAGLLPAYMLWMKCDRFTKDRRATFDQSVATAQIEMSDCLQHVQEVKRQQLALAMRAQSG